MPQSRERKNNPLPPLLKAIVMQLFPRITLYFLSLVLATAALAAQPALKLGVGLFQPDREKNDASYKPLADYLAA